MFFQKASPTFPFWYPFLHVHVLGCLPWFQYIILYQALRLRFAFPNIPKVKHIETMLHVWLSSAACSIFKHVIFRIRRWTCPIHRGKCIEEFSSRTSSPSLHGLVCVWKRACYSREFRSRKHVMGKSPVRARDTSWGCSWVMDHSPRNASSPWLRACKTEIIVAVELKLYVIVTKTMVFNVLPKALNCMQRRVPFLHRKAYMLRYFGLYRLKSSEKRAEIDRGRWIWHITSDPDPLLYYFTACCNHLINPLTQLPWIFAWRNVSKPCDKYRHGSLHFLAWCASSGLAISPGDAEPSSSAHRARQFALAELKSLAKTGPGCGRCNRRLGEAGDFGWPVVRYLKACLSVPHKLNV